MPGYNPSLSEVMSAPPQQPMKVCMSCGRQIGATYNACPYCGAPQQAAAPMGAPMEQSRVCMGCGRTIATTYFACPYCGRPAGAMGVQMGHKETAYPIVAGVFEILAGIIGLGFGGLTIVGAGAASTIPYVDVAGIIMVCGAILVVFGLISLLGGIFALQRKNYGMALVGAIFALFCGFLIFGILALIFVILAKDEFH